MPISTAHQATCRYSKSTTLCELPTNCTTRVTPKLEHLSSDEDFKTEINRRKKKKSYAKVYGTGLCGQIPIVRSEGSIYD